MKIFVLVLWLTLTSGFEMTNNTIFSTIYRTYYQTYGNEKLRATQHQDDCLQAYFIPISNQTLYFQFFGRRNKDPEKQFKVFEGEMSLINEVEDIQCFLISRDTTGHHNQHKFCFLEVSQEILIASDGYHDATVLFSLAIDPFLYDQTSYDRIHEWANRLRFNESTIVSSLPSGDCP